MLLLILIPFSIFSQPKDSLTTINRKFKKEIAIDFQNIFKGMNGGTALIFKLKKTNSRLVSLSFSKYYRFQLNLSGSFVNNQKLTHFNFPYGHYDAKDSSGINICPMFGNERVNHFEKFNVFYGLDFGPFYNHWNNAYIVLIDSLFYPYTFYTYYDNFLVKSTKYGISTFAFFGINYRISERFSASIESGFTLYYYFSKSLYRNLVHYTQTNTFQTILTEDKRNGLGFSIKYLRFLSLNYHFK